MDSGSKSDGKETYQTATFSAINCTLTTLGVKPSLKVKKQATNCLRYGTIYSVVNQRNA